MKNSLIAVALAVATLATTGVAAHAGTAAPEVRPDTVIHVQARPPWPNCRRWDSRTVVCRDPAWRGRNWRGWYGRSTCRRGHGWWIDKWGRWRRC